MQYGYFDEEKREYVITNPDTPAPWANYLGSPEYGAIITVNAGGYSFVRSGAARGISGYMDEMDVQCAPAGIALTGGGILLVTDTYHAYVVKTPQGNRVLVHVGLGTVNMQGAGFEPLVAVGDSVVVGQPLLNVDLDLVRSSGHQDMVITALPQDA